MGGITVATVLAFVDAVIAILPRLVAAGVSIAELVEKAEAIWSEANLDPSDLRWTETRAQIEAQLARLQARAKELGAA